MQFCRASPIQCWSFSIAHFTSSHTAFESCAWFCVEFVVNKQNHVGLSVLLLFIICMHTIRTLMMIGKMCSLLLFHSNTPHNRIWVWNTNSYIIEKSFSIWTLSTSRSVFNLHQLNPRWFTLAQQSEAWLNSIRISLNCLIELDRGSFNQIHNTFAKIETREKTNLDDDW